MQRMQARFAVLLVQIIKRPNRDGSEGSSDGRLGPLVDPIGCLVAAYLGHSLLFVSGLDIVEFLRQDFATGLIEGRLEIFFQLIGGDWRDRAVMEFLEELLNLLLQPLKNIRGGGFFACVEDVGSSKLRHEESFPANRIFGQFLFARKGSFFAISTGS